MKVDKRIAEFFKKGKLTEKEVIKILAVSNILLVLFIVGMKFNDYLKSSELPTICFEETDSAEGSDNYIDHYKIEVDINTDSIILLCQLPGIGEAKASAIIDYRAENGDFTSIEELLDVPGIGESLYNKVKDYVYVELPTTAEEST